MLPPTIPIFPLPNAVLFPNVFMPLHIFEPRYRAMVADALAGDRIIGMVLLRAGFERGLRGPAADLSDRLRRRHHALRAAAGRPLQHRPQGDREVPHHRRRRQQAVPPGGDRFAAGTGVGRGSRRTAATSACGSRRCWPRPSSARAAIRNFRRPSPTRISSTRWRSTWDSNRSSGRHSSNATACWRAAAA